MTISESLLPEFDYEMANTRKVIERVPEDGLGWKPHEKSMTMAQLATHLANIPSWGSRAIEADSFDMAPPGVGPLRMAEAGSKEEALALFDRNVAAARAAIQAAGDDHLSNPWSLMAGGRTIFTLPRITVLRRYLLNHIVHHRAQLGVYLRLNGVPVPAIYGPTADEQ